MKKLSSAVTILETPEEVAERKRAAELDEEEQKKSQQTLASVLTPRPGDAGPTS